MKDPVRLLDGAGSDAERALLGAAASEEPPADGARRLAAALGVVGVVSAGAGASVGASADAGASASAGASAGGVASKIALKWLLIAPVGVVATAVAVVLALRGGAPSAPEAGLRPHAAEPVPVAQPAEPAHPATEPKPQAAEPEPAAPEARAQAPSEREHAGRPVSKSIAREIEQLDAARERLQRGDARGALAQLDIYRREHEGGALEQEATVLRIEALARAGERAAARRAAERFLRAHPGSPHADRIRSLAGVRSDAP